MRKTHGQLRAREHEQEAGGRPSSYRQHHGLSRPPSTAYCHPWASRRAGRAELRKRKHSHPWVWEAHAKAGSEPRGPRGEGCSVHSPDAPAAPEQRACGSHQRVREKIHKGKRERQRPRGRQPQRRGPPPAPPARRPRPAEGALMPLPGTWAGPAAASVSLLHAAPAVILECRPRHVTPVWPPRAPRISRGPLTPSYGPT